jgi:hypothetical protein
MVGKEERRVSSSTADIQYSQTLNSPHLLKGGDNIERFRFPQVRPPALEVGGLVTVSPALRAKTLRTASPGCSLLLSRSSLPSAAIARGTVRRSSHPTYNLSHWLLIPTAPEWSTGSREA